MDKRVYRNLERIFKGVASHRRIQIIDALKQEPEMSVAEIAKEVRLDFRTTSEHLRKLAIAGIIMKRHDGAAVRHALTDRGETILKFCRTLE